MIEKETIGRGKRNLTLRPEVPQAVRSDWCRTVGSMHPNKANTRWVPPGCFYERIKRRGESLTFIKVRPKVTWLLQRLLAHWDLDMNLRSLESCLETERSGALPRRPEQRNRRRAFSICCNRCQIYVAAQRDTRDMGLPPSPLAMQLIQMPIIPPWRGLDVST